MPSYSEELQEAIELFDLEEYVEENCRDALPVPSAPDEVRIHCLNPSCDDDSHHLYINITDKRWICFKCGYGTRDLKGTGWLPRLIADIEGIPYSLAKSKILKGAKRNVTEEDLTEFLERSFKNQDEDPEKDQDAVKLPDRFFPLRKSGISSRNYLQYLLDRGLDPNDLERFDIRYCSTNYRNPKLSWQWRVIFPIYDLSGACRSAVGRSITRQSRVAWANWPNSMLSDLLWPLGEFKYGEWFPVEDVEWAVLTEGVFDALAVNKLTSRRAFATFGKKISDGQKALLQTMGVKTIVLAWDWDAKYQITKAVEKLLGYFEEVVVFPFRSKKWQHHDFGDALADPAKHADLVKDLRKGLHDPVLCDSPEFCAWAVA